MNLALRIVAHLLEDDRDRVDAEVDDFIARYEPGWTQVGGDFGSPWEYGGTWYHWTRKDILHCPGLEGQGLEDKASWDMTLTPEEEAALLAQFPVLDDGDGVDENERDRDDAREEQLQAKADAFNAARKLPVYSFSEDPIAWLEKDWADAIPELIGQWGEEGPAIWERMPLHQKWIALAECKGWYEFDHYPDHCTKAELRKRLGPDIKL